MSNIFGALSDIHVDVEHKRATFCYEDIRLNLHDSIVEVDQAVMSLEQFNNAMAQLDATVASIEAMGGMVDDQVFRIVNQNNQLGKLLGVYVPPSLRFEMAEGTTDSTQATNASNAEKKETGTSVTDKAKELAKKMWTMLKAFFAKIAAGMKSFWTWLRNGCMSNKASNQKLLEAIQADSTGAKFNEAVKQAKGYITFAEAQKSLVVCQRILDAPFIKWLEGSNCSNVMTALDKNSAWSSAAQVLLGLDEAQLGDAWLKVVAAGEGGLLPTIEQDKEKLNNLKTANKEATLGTKEWTRDALLDFIPKINEYYDKVNTFKEPLFIEYASKYDWENSDYAKTNTDNALTKKKCQAVCKFYAQWNKVVLACVDPVQAHFNALKKFMNVDAGGNQTAQPTQTEGAQTAADQAGKNAEATGTV